jgi:hypothetical protein
MAVFKSAFAGGNRRQGQGGGVAGQHCNGIHYHKFSVNIPTAAIDSADEQILLWKFPDDSDCWLFRGGTALDTDDTVPTIGADFQITLTDLETTTTALTWSLGISDVDGVLDTTLITDSAVGQAAGIDYLDAIAVPLDVSGKYLCIDVTAASTNPVAGTATVEMKVAYGVKLEADTGVA